MRAVVQRVTSARVAVDSRVVAAIEHGLLVLVGITDAVRAPGVSVQTGEFQAHMAVESVNDGPVTILLDSGKAF